MIQKMSWGKGATGVYYINGRPYMYIMTISYFIDKSDYCLTPILQFFSYIMARTSLFRWDDDSIVLDQHAELDFYCASSLKQQSAGRHVAPLGHIILIPSQPVFALSP
jgi:hypothetical protein